MAELMTLKQSKQSNILVVDHETGFLKNILSGPDSGVFRATRVTRINDVLSKLATDKFDIILLREYLPDGHAMELIDLLTAAPDRPAIIVFGTGHDALSAEQYLKNGVLDYILESESATTLFTTFKNILDYQRQSRERRETRIAANDTFRDNGIVGTSPAIQRCLDLLVKAGPSDANLLIVGESGTGKELFARASHALSPRSDKEMIVVDCASLPENLTESILFGHVRGAFTGADRASDGLIRQANGSTLFLDEIGELPLELQKKFLRVLQERQLRSLGGHKTIPVDFRLIAATNKDLKQMVDQGLFRKDLFFRLITFQLELPTLRSRPDDLTELAYFFMNNYCSARRLKSKRFSPEYLLTLRRYQWPGNVRELFNVIERSIAAAAEHEILLPLHLPITIRIHALDNLNSARENPDEIFTTAGNSDPKSLPTLQEMRSNALARLENKYLRVVLQASGGDISKACKITAISRSRLYALLKDYRLSPAGTIRK
jgi:two-component system NtrC family response regulator